MTLCTCLRYERNYFHEIAALLKLTLCTLSLSTLASLMCVQPWVQEEGISVQIGGSDQWGNITAGTDLVRKLLQQEGAYGLTFPLLLKSDGSKFGKSVGGAIWLSRSLLSPYKFYQYLFATPDSDVIKFMKILTFLDLEEIQSLEATMGKEGYVPNSVQRRLAEEVTLFVHGEEGLTEALNATQALAPGGATQLDWKTLEAITEDVPSCSVAQASLLGSSLVDLCVSTGLLQSKTAVRRMIKQVSTIELANIKCI